MTGNFTMDIPQWVKAACKTVKFKKGQPIFAQNSPLNLLYVVEKGSVIILNVDNKGQEAKLVMVSEGGTIGEMEAIVGVNTVVYAAKAYTDCELLAMPTSEFLRWIDTDAAACKQLARLLAQKLYAAASQSTQYTSMDAMDRLIVSLASFGVGVVYYTRQELAETCSVSVRTINRCIKKLDEQNRISLLRGKIVISLSQLHKLKLSVKDIIKEDVL